MRVIFNLKLKPGGAVKWTAVFQERFLNIRAWEGCEEIYLGVDKDDPNHLMIVEKWSSKEAYADYREWAKSQPGTSEIMNYLIDEIETTYLDDAGV